jgi:maltoporin
MRQSVVLIIFYFLLVFLINTAVSQPLLDPQETKFKSFSIGTYGRVGANWSFDVQGALARTFNLNGMGMLGGRMEEMDYLELLTALHIPTFKSYINTEINIQVRMSAYNASGQLFGNVNTNSLGGIILGLPEIYAQAKQINGTPWSVWLGARLYRGGDIHIADYFYFDDLSAQGLGIEYGNTQFTILFVSAADTNSTLPPYFYVNTATGTPSLELRQRVVMALMHTYHFKGIHNIKLLAEFQRLADASAEIDTLNTVLNYPSDIGWVAGIKHVMALPMLHDGSFNQISVRFGQGIANGGDGGMTRTWLTYGAPNLETQKFSKAYSLSITEHFLMNFSNTFALNGYMVYTKSHGAADTDHIAKTYFDREVYNMKTDFAAGLRSFYYFSNIFHLINEAHYALRKDGLNDPASVLKFSIVPTFVPTGERSAWARPHFRFIYTIAFYNQFAKENLYSPFLQAVGPKKIGQYFGIRAEWWIF